MDVPDGQAFLNTLILDSLGMCKKWNLPHFLLIKWPIAMSTNKSIIPSWIKPMNCSLTVILSPNC